jgi:peptide deformylase
MRGIVKDTKADSILRKRVEDVEKGEHGKVFSRMWLKTMQKRKNAVGFACNQLGMDHYAFLGFVDGKWEFFANPVIVRSSKEKSEALEGCLSIPKKNYIVSRHEEIELDWEDDHGKGQSRVFRGFDARVIQHEIDHLNGVLILDKGTEAK